MNLPELCIRRPVMTTLLVAAFVIFGIIAYRALPVSELPSVDFPTISVTAALPGASPETMAAAVATPLEGQFSTIAGLDSMNSTSAQGSTSITLQFTLDRNIDAAAQDVQSAIAVALRKLPPNMPAPPSFRKVNPADSPIYYIALASPTLPLPLVNEYAETQLAQRISTISGVAQVLIYGSQKFAVRIQANPDQLAARGLGIDELHQAVAQANVNQPVGLTDGERRTSLPHTAPANADEARTQAEAQLRTLARRFVVGRGIAETDAALKVGAAVRLNGLGGLFSGQYVLSEVRHRFDETHGLRTEFTAERASLGGHR